jgi:hypothetical protein
MLLKKKTHSFIYEFLDKLRLKPENCTAWEFLVNLNLETFTANNCSQSEMQSVLTLQAIIGNKLTEVERYTKLFSTVLYKYNKPALFENGRYSGDSIVTIACFSAVSKLFYLENIGSTIMFTNSLDYTKAILLYNLGIGFVSHKERKEWSSDKILEKMRRNLLTKEQIFKGLLVIMGTRFFTDALRESWEILVVDDLGVHKQKLTRELFAKEVQQHLLPIIINPKLLSGPLDESYKEVIDFNTYLDRERMQVKTVQGKWLLTRFSLNSLFTDNRLFLNAKEMMLEGVRLDFLLEDSRLQKVYLEPEHVNLNPTTIKGFLDLDRLPDFDLDDFPFIMKIRDKMKRLKIPIGTDLDELILKQGFATQTQTESKTAKPYHPALGWEDPEAIVGLGVVITEEDSFIAVAATAEQFKKHKEALKENPNLLFFSEEVDPGFDKELQKKGTITKLPQVSSPPAVSSPPVPVLASPVPPIKTVSAAYKPLYEKEVPEPTQADSPFILHPTIDRYVAQLMLSGEPIKLRPLTETGQELSVDKFIQQIGKCTVGKSESTSTDFEVELKRDILDEFYYFPTSGLSNDCGFRVLSAMSLNVNYNGYSFAHVKNEFNMGENDMLGEEKMFYLAKQMKRNIVLLCNIDRKWKLQVGLNNLAWRFEYVYFSSEHYTLIRPKSSKWTKALLFLGHKEKSYLPFFQLSRAKGSLLHKNPPLIESEERFKWQRLSLEELLLEEESYKAKKSITSQKMVELQKRRALEQAEAKDIFLEDVKFKSKRKVTELEEDIERLNKQIAGLKKQGEKARAELNQPGFNNDKTNGTIEATENSIVFSEGRLTAVKKNLTKAMAKTSEVDPNMVEAFMRGWEQENPMPVLTNDTDTDPPRVFLEVLEEKKLAALEISTAHTEIQNDFTILDYSTLTQQWAKKFIDLPALQQPKPLISYKQFVREAAIRDDEYRSKKKLAKKNNEKFNEPEPDMFFPCDYFDISQPFLPEEADERAVKIKELREWETARQKYFNVEIYLRICKMMNEICGKKIGEVVIIFDDFVHSTRVGAVFITNKNKELFSFLTNIVIPNYLKSLMLTTVYSDKFRKDFLKQAYESLDLTVSYLEDEVEKIKEFVSNLIAVEYFLAMGVGDRYLDFYTEKQKIILEAIIHNISNLRIPSEIKLHYIQLHSQLLGKLRDSMIETTIIREEYNKSEKFHIKMRLLRQLQILEREREKPLLLRSNENTDYLEIVKHENDNVKIRNMEREKNIRMIQDKLKDLGEETASYQSSLFELENDSEKLIQHWDCITNPDDVALEKEATYNFLTKAAQERMKQNNDILDSLPLKYYQRYINSETKLIEDILANLKYKIIDFITPEKRFCIFASYVILNNFGKAKRLNPYQKRLYMALLEYVSKPGFYEALEMFAGPNPIAVTFKNNDVKFWSAYLLPELFEEMNFIGRWESSYVHGNELTEGELTIRFKMFCKLLMSGKSDMKPLLGLPSDNEYVLLLKSLLTI